jgi:hypothetical protein
MTSELDRELKLYKALSDEGIEQLAHHFSVKPSKLRTRMNKLGVWEAQQSISNAGWRKQDNQAKYIVIALFILFAVAGVALFDKFFSPSSEDNFCIDDKFPCTTVDQVRRGAS